jgi:hypothetical protein
VGENGSHVLGVGEWSQDGDGMEQMGNQEKGKGKRPRPHYRELNNATENSTHLEHVQYLPVLLLPQKLV